jgi:hypothetical protein
MQKVIVYDSENNLLSPCHAARARKLIKQKKAEIIYANPFSIKLINWEKIKMEEQVCRTKELVDKFLNLSVASSILHDHEIIANEIVQYEKGIDVKAVVVQEDGKTIEIVERGDRVFPPNFTLRGVGTSLEKAAEDLKENEENLCLQLLLKSSTLHNPPIPINKSFFEEGGPILKRYLEELQYSVERWRLLTDKFIIPREAFGAFKKINSMDIDPVSSSDLKEYGIFASIWGVTIFIISNTYIYLSAGCPYILAVADGRYLGGRTLDYKTINVKELPDKLIEITIQETMCIVNSKAIAIGIDQKYLDMQLNMAKIEELKQCNKSELRNKTKSEICRVVIEKLSDPNIEIGEIRKLIRDSLSYIERVR